MMKSITFKLNLEELQTLRNMIDNAITVAKDLEQTKKNLDSIPGSEKVKEFFLSVHPFTDYFNINGERQKIGILPVTKEDKE